MNSLRICAFCIALLRADGSGWVPESPTPTRSQKEIDEIDKDITLLRSRRNAEYTMGNLTFAQGLQYEEALKQSNLALDAARGPCVQNLATMQNLSHNVDVEYTEAKYGYLAAETWQHDGNKTQRAISALDQVKKNASGWKNFTWWVVDHATEDVLDFARLNHGLYKPLKAVRKLWQSFGKEEQIVNKETEKRIVVQQQADLTEAELAAAKTEEAGAARASEAGEPAEPPDDAQATESIQEKMAGVARWFRGAVQKLGAAGQKYGGAAADVLEAGAEAAVAPVAMIADPHGKLDAERAAQSPFTQLPQGLNTPLSQRKGAPFLQGREPLPMQLSGGVRPVPFWQDSDKLTSSFYRCLFGAIAFFVASQILMYVRFQASRVLEADCAPYVALV